MSSSSSEFSLSASPVVQSHLPLLFCFPMLFILRSSFNVSYEVPFTMLSNIFSLVLPFCVLLSIRLPITSFSKQLFMRIYSIQFCCLCRINFMKHLFPVNLLSTSFDILSIQLIFSSHLQIYISNASSLIISSFHSVHVSHPYNAILHTVAFTNLFFSYK